MTAVLAAIGEGTDGTALFLLGLALLWAWLSYGVRA